MSETKQELDPLGFLELAEILSSGKKKTDDSGGRKNPFGRELPKLTKVSLLYRGSDGFHRLNLKNGFRLKFRSEPTWFEDGIRITYTMYVKAWHSISKKNLELTKELGYKLLQDEVPIKNLSESEASYYIDKIGKMPRLEGEWTNGAYLPPPTRSRPRPVSVASSIGASVVSNWAHFEPTLATRPYSEPPPPEVSYAELNRQREEAIIAETARRYREEAIRAEAESRFREEEARARYRAHAHLGSGWSPPTVNYTYDALTGLVSVDMPLQSSDTGESGNAG